ncbi:MAG: HD domain-containing protein [Thermoleophilia bacterium]
MDPHSAHLPSPLLGALLEVTAGWEHPVWLVGGTVRDRQCGRFSPDLDAVTAGDPAEFARRVARRLDLPWFPLSHEFGAYRVVGRPLTGGGEMAGAAGHLDVAGLRGADIAADLALRDFTVNAMALPLPGGAVVDPFGGRAHLAEGRLVPVGDSIFADDPVRLLRAARFAHVLGLRIDPELRALARAEAVRLSAAAAERILIEVVLTLEPGRSAAAVRLWDNLGLLEVFLPEVSALRDVGQSPFHHHDVLGHTLETMERIDEVIATPGRWFGLSWEILEARLAQPVDGVMPRPVALRLGALLHDVAKPETRAVGEEGRILFWGHTEVGGPVAAAICGRLRCSAAATGLVRAVVERHLDIGFLQHERPAPPREVVRFLWRSAPWEPEVILVSAADRLATRGPRTEESHFEGHLAVARRLMDTWRQRTEEGVPPPPVDGDVLMAELGLEPGPLLGRVLREVRLAWEAGEVAAREEALALARDHLDGLRSVGAGS